MLSSSTGFVVGKHYCGGKVVHTAFMHEAAGCGMKSDEDRSSCGREEKPHTPQQQDQMHQTPCCQDVLQLIQPETPQEKLQNQELQTGKSLPTAPAMTPLAALHKAFPKDAFQHLAKAPPPPLLYLKELNLLAFVQVFLL